DGDSPTMIERYRNDDDAFARRGSAFLAEHQVRSHSDSRPQHNPAAFQRQLSTALTTSIAHARDNELYVLLVDLLELGDDATPLVNVLRAAVARHHQVVVLTPWPSGLPVPPRSSRGLPIAQPTEAPGKLRVAQFVQKQMVMQYQRRFRAIRAELVRIGATVLPMEPGQSTAQVLERLDRLRGGRRRR
ncbi:MAG: hypothetical protein ACRCZF_17845, partial [Gemmataceae bacterium]